MVGLRNRSAIAKVSKALLDDLDSLVVQLRYFLLEEHDSDGKHTGITYSGPITNITIVNGIVTSVS